MISYSNYKLIKEADTPGSAPAPASPAGSAPAGAPAASGGPPSMGGGMPDMGGGMPQVGTGAGTKPEGIKSSNVWDTLEKYLSK